MKAWYQRTQKDNLAKTYGEYPDLWKQVLNWNGWKESRKLFLQDQQQGGSIPKKKRKSRWGDASEQAPSSTQNANNYPDPKRRFNNAPPPRTGLPLPGLNRLPPHQHQKVQQLQSRLRNINDRLNTVERDAARVDGLPRGHRDRSPSPPPMYGADGKRQNTRAVRWRERLSGERQSILQQLLSLTGASGMIKTKKTVKVPIPVEEYPNYNFIGLIIGPRGKTQKELEGKTGCKIAIRGKGSVKQGARKLSNDTEEPLHVVISGDDPKAVDAAKVMIEDMLVVLDDEKNVHKQQQLRELAVLNGTLKQNDEFCANCGQKGHRAFECPRNIRRNAAVRCAICGDTSHPTRDCTQQKAPAVPATADSDYRSFMAELEGNNNSGSAPPPAANVPPTNGGPPPPPQLPPPPMHGLPPPPAHGLPPPPMYGGTQPPPQQQQQQQQPIQVAPGQETAAWDPNAYYGNGGAGGLNWWD